ncbi:MAG: ABC transporter ATP-binding protein [Clostridia bacterium]|nr:ABC transporter ATP-binding protein [Clostridia bacterium]
MPNQAYLRVAGLSKRFGSGENAVAAIENLSFTLDEGRFLSILGPSGCGKSTLFNIIAGLMAPDSGDVTLNGESMLLRPGMTGYMLQKDLLLPWRTVADNIILSQTLHGVRRSKALDAALPDARACGLETMLRRRPDELSGGQRQRAALVRTLQTGKPLLLLDEPFGALDAITRLHLQELLTDVCMKKDKTVLFITHDVDEALLLSDEVLIMGSQPGRIIAHYHLPQEKPRTLKTLALPRLIEIKGEIMQLLDQEVKRHDPHA